MRMVSENRKAEDILNDYPLLTFDERKEILQNISL